MSQAHGDKQDLHPGLSDQCRLSLVSLSLVQSHCVVEGPWFLVMCFSRFALGVDKSPGDSSRETRRDLEVPVDSRLVLLSTMGYEM